MSFCSKHVLFYMSKVDFQKKEKKFLTETGIIF
jgi:hypothetical protein